MYSIKKMDISLKLIKLKRLIKKAIEDQNNKIINVPSNINLSGDNIIRRQAYTELSTQNEEDVSYCMVHSGKTQQNNDLILFRYMYTNKELNNNLYYIELNNGKIIKIKYLDNFLFPKELIKIRKILSWDTNYILMDIAGIICGDYGDSEMKEYGADHGGGFSNIQGFLDGPDKKNKGYNWDSHNNIVMDD